MRRKAFTGSHALFRDESYSHTCGSPASYTFTPRQVIAHHRSVASPFGCRASQCVNCKHVRTHQVGIYTSSKDYSPIQIQLLVFAAAVCFDVKYVSEEFSRLISSLLVPFLLPFILFVAVFRHS
uniref:Uncharacterized protein n=1 Tax=Setaria viridis TaxID=4556 RepID=A0A4U6TME1_SETVI|nr:hypothetical protein SEVIR_7G043300v2 [Setaria viridis]